PMPCLIKYSICGCYKGDDIMQDDVGNKNKYFQHSPWIDKDYHKVILNAPLRFRYDFKISDFCEAMVTKVNEYAQRRVFSLKEFSEMWSELLYIKYSLVNNDIDTDELKEIFNAKIDLYKIKPTPQHDFYLQHYLDYLDDFEKGKILKRCRYCDKAFDFKDKKLYCNAKCARAAQNLRGYQRYTPTRKRTSRIRMRKYRQNGDYLDKRRQSSQD
ncbi:MAG: hypothetical protein NTV71_01805, partial [Candidatus Omnitrophica bacterium]|nr:hypothetical protein [Candidatus Omnitrophota bacterium]